MFGLGGGEEDPEGFHLMPEHEDDGGGLLPMDTKIFVSRHIPEASVWYIVLANAVLLPLLILVALGLSASDGSAATSVWSVILVIFLLSSAVLLFLLRRSEQAYKHMVSRGTWMQGVFVFQVTGDVVVRFHFLWKQYEYTFSSDSLQRCEVTYKRAWYSCRAVPHVLLEGLSEGELKSCEFPEDLLISSGAAVVGFIKARRR